MEVRDANRPRVQAKRFTRADVPLATPRALRAHPSSQTRQPGPRASRLVLKRWCNPHSRARVPWRHKAVVISTTQKLHVPWLTWAMQPVPSSRNPLHLLLQRPSDQGEPSLLIKKAGALHRLFYWRMPNKQRPGTLQKTITISSQRQISVRSCWNLTSL